jgi:predicted phage terminase large subunit-like protein
MATYVQDTGQFLPPDMLNPMVIDAMDMDLAEKSLSDFTRQAWHVIEPATTMLWNWHLDAISEHLEAVTAGEITRLVINMPPRHMKSIEVSVCWPAWEWGPRNLPATRWVFSSYANALALRDSVKCRRLIRSPWYQARWGDRFTLTGDQNAKERYETDKTGLRLATSVEGIGTGEGGDRIVVDDPHNVKEAESEAIRLATLDWWDGTMSTRLNDPKTGCFVIVMQRVHEKDLTGHVLSKDRGYTHLCLPCEYERAHPYKMTNWPGAKVKEPRKREGELLWPERFDRKAVDTLKVDLGSYKASGQLQQRPSPAEGGVYKRKWFRRWQAVALPRFHRLIWCWDTAVSEKNTAAFTVGGLWGEAEAGYFRLAHFRERVEYPELKAAVRDCYNAKPTAAILVEDKSSGQQVVQELKRADVSPLGEAKPVRLPIIGISCTDAGKLVRARAVSPLAEAGLVWIPEDAPWVEPWLQEVCTFPNAEYADQVDEMSQALAYLKGDSSAFGGGDFS